MKITSVHERRFAAGIEETGRLIDSLAGPEDRLWPREQWPPMAFDRGLSEGAAGGHGPIRYRVREHNPGLRAVFEFDQEGVAAGLHGIHYFEAEAQGRESILRHVIKAEGGPSTWLQWQLVIRPLHDALLRDSLDLAEQALTGTVKNPAAWSPWVRFLRRMLAPKNGKAA